MLSKAEVLYLQSQKQVSQSYERKLKCLIGKKVEVLQKELPLLSRLLAGNSIMSSNTCDQVREPAPISNRNDQKHHDYNIGKSDPSFKRATKYSNSQSKRLESVSGEEVNSLNLYKSSSSVSDVSTPATEFSNVEYDAATKNSNSKNPVNVTKYSPKPSTNTPMSHENLNKSIQNDLISEWAGSDSNQRPPPCQGGILTRLDHRPLYYNY